MRNSVVATEQPSIKKVVGRAKKHRSPLGDQLMVKRARVSTYDFDQLFKEYRPLIRGWVSAYYIKGADRSDLLQEAQIGFWKAVNDYDGYTGNFRSFAEMCVKRHVITAVKAATRNKHEILNSAVSFSRPAEGIDGHGDTLIDMIIDHSVNLGRQFSAGHDLDLYIQCIVNCMSDLEAQAIVMQAYGGTYEEIAQACKVSEKAVDNALIRARKKLALVRDTGQLPKRRERRVKPKPASTRRSRVNPAHRLEALVKHLEQSGPIRSEGGRAILELSKILGVSDDVARRVVDYGRLRGQLLTEVRSNRRTYAIELASAT